MSVNLLLDKYRGCLVGALIGDCLGSGFEFVSRIDKEFLASHIDELEENQGQSVELTDDTQMTQELADSLICKKGFDAQDLARRFTLRYYKDGRTAGYGGNVIDVFRKLKETNYQDPLRPAREQFDGSGSYGNGSGMRVAPAALFAYPDLHRTADLADQTSIITHTHEDGLNGAIFQALAIRRSLLAPIIDYNKYLEDFLNDLKEADISESYLEALLNVKQMLQKGNVTDSEVNEKLGTRVAALYSIPTALFAFLWALHPIPNIATTCPFRRTVEYAISLGGDTDTIASMAGAIAGAQFGLTRINDNLARSCPDYDRAISQADKLFALSQGIQ